MFRRIQPSHLLLILGFVWILFFLGLGGLGLVGPDEPRYAQIAREMLVSGDFVTPRYFGEPWLEKPVLYYWLAAAAYSIFGVNEFAARLPSALAALLGVFCVYLVGRQREGPLEGLFSSLVLAASILYFSLARAASTDMVFSAAMAVAWTSLFLLLFGDKGWWRGSSTSGSQRGLLLTFYVFLGLATLAKGPAGLVLPLVSLAVILGVTGRRDLAARFRPVTGVLVLLAVVLPWYGLCTLANGWGFVEEFLIRHNLERFFTDRYEHPQPFWFFPAVALIGFFPWSLQLIPSARGLFRHADRWRSLAAAQDLFLWLWLLTPLVVFSLSRSKLPGYLLPAAPAMALLIGHQVRLWLKFDPGEARPRWFKDFFFYQALCLILTGLALPLYAPRLNLPVESLAAAASWLLAGTGVLALLFYWRRRRTASVSCYLASVALAVILVTGGVFAQVDAAESSRQLAAYIQEEKGFRDQPLFVYGISRNVAYGLGFYLNSPARIIYSEGDVHYPRGREAFFVTSLDFKSEGFFARNQVEGRAEYQSRSILRIRHKLE
ncbi:MAG: glycosyltransferase family 39 protein [Acidobacteria bacterium]|nr:glycosyltransferase family 39 protein [Acidobacteriota bacterium]